MSRFTLPLLILAAVLVAALCAWWTLSRGIGIEPGAQAARHEPLPPFHRIELGGSAEVTLVQSNAESIDVQAARYARVDADVVDGRLRLRAEDRRRWWNRLFGGRSPSTPRITLRFRTLDVIDANGSVKIRAGKLETPSLRIAASGGASLAIDDLRATSLRVSGSGALDAKLAGRVQQQFVSISGAGSYQAERLVADDATVNVSGVGDVVVHAEKTLRANISGAGIIEYTGDPVVSEHVSGIGRVRRRGPEHAANVQTAQWSEPRFLKNSGPPVTGSMSSCTPGMIRTSATRQSRSSVSSIAATSCTVS
jgi:hypothetical protein